MEIEKISQQTWLDVITGKINCDYEFLALKILLGRLQLNVKHDSSEKACRQYVDELKNFFIKTQRIASSQNDLQKIISKGGM